MNRDIPEVSDVPLSRKCPVLLRRSECPDCWAKILWQDSITAFSPLQELEAGRWTLVGKWGPGADDFYYQPTESARTTAFRKDESGTFLSNISYTGDWNRATRWITENWFNAETETRVKTVLSEFGQSSANAPVFYPASGVIAADDLDINIYTYGGDLIYTVNGDDPKSLTAAQLLTDPSVRIITTKAWKEKTGQLIFAGQNLTLKARSRVGGVAWSALVTATFTK